MIPLSSAGCMGLTVMIIIVLVLSYNWYNTHSSEVMTQFRNGLVAGKATALSEDDLVKLANTSETFQADYDPATVGLDRSIRDSHKEFTDETYAFAHGASASDVVRDDPNDVNPRVGLRQIDYTSAISGDDARTVSSETPYQMRQQRSSMVL